LTRVLIVDDEPGIRFALRRWFERQQWTVVEAGDGERALTLLRASTETGDDRFDLVVCDLNLPLVGGEALLSALRAERPALCDRVVLTTGDAVADAEPGTLLATHPHVLQKPFDLGTLRTHVSAITG
jgi:DNA-binding response OmpR family regulator